MNINGTAYLSDTDFDGNVSQSSGYAAFLDLRILDTLTASGVTHTPSWKSKTIRYCSMGPSYSFVDSDGTGHTGHLVTSYSDSTINYLGY
jgi:hypothetical protein